MGIPFALRRPILLARYMAEDREHPDLERLAAIEDPERFLWAILPHAARTFAPCIVLLPARIATAVAVAYLYCRMLDTYEDLLVDPAERDAALAAFASRREAPAPSIGCHRARDGRDAAHLLLVERHAMVDRVHETLAPEVQALTRKLVQEMADGMRWSSGIFERQGGVIENDEQLARYCRCVIGQPVLFASRASRWARTGVATLPEEVERDALAVGEMIQLANITRDIEKDLARGIAYHPRLRNDLGGAGDADPALGERVRSVREELLTTALRRAPAYRRLVDYIGPGRWSLVRASGVLMMLFTDRYFRRCALRAGRPAWGRHRAGWRLILSAIPAAWSKLWTTHVLSRIERNFLRAASSD